MYKEETKNIDGYYCKKVVFFLIYRQDHPSLSRCAFQNIHFFRTHLKKKRREKC